MNKTDAHSTRSRLALTTLLLLLPLVVLPLMATGCFHRALDIRTNPEGATVSVNGEVVGPSPVVVPFDFYGIFHVVARAEGHLSSRVAYDAESPWYSSFPLDIVVELLLPWAVDDVHRIDLELEPLPEKLDGKQVDEVRAKAKAEREAFPRETN